VPLEGEKRIRAVATAASGSPEIGKLLGEMFDVLGPHAHIVIEPYTSTYHDRAYREGTLFKGGYFSPYLANDTLRRMSILNDVHIAIVDVDFDSADAVEHVLNTVVQAGGKNLLLVCRQLSDKCISMLGANNERGAVKSCAVKPADVGEARQNILTNLALITGAEFISEKVSQTYRDLTPQRLGFASRVTATRDQFTVIGGRGDRQAVRKRAQELRAILKRTPHPTDRDHLSKAISQLSDGIGELRIGALTEADRKSQMETAEVAVKTVAACIEGGIVPGGGAAYLSAIPDVLAVGAKPGDETFGVQMVARALEAPMRQIVLNAALHPPLAIAESRQAGLGFGFDVRTKRVVNMIDEGIADSAYVSKTALERAASVAIMLLTTDALVLHRKPKESVQP
jgi:chaperonin GroEL